jgi:ectoine hydroxylase-related dioxygenase (phytanoyl-CoA dioxygenase family)
MWLPLHDIPSGAALLLFPQCYRRQVAFYDEVDRNAPPDTWGYGQAVRQAMSRGDVLLFHSQHFHASPTQEPDLARVTVEIRVGTGCHDDNGTTYRRSFWNVRNFTPRAMQGRLPASQTSRRTRILTRQ